MERIQDILVQLPQVTKCGTKAACHGRRPGPNIAATTRLEKHNATQVGQGNRWPVVQFDATMACPSAVLEMLFYSDPTLLRILPALPDMLPTGRTGGTADIDWDIPNRRVVAHITSPTERTADIRFPARLQEATAAGATLAASDFGDVYRKVTLPAGKTVTFTVRLAE